MSKGEVTSHTEHPPMADTRRNRHRPVGQAHDLVATRGEHAIHDRHDDTVARVGERLTDRLAREVLLGPDPFGKFAVHELDDVARPSKQTNSRHRQTP